MSSAQGGSHASTGAIAALLLLAVIWGGSIPATKLGLADFPPLTLTGFRYIAAAPFFAALLLFQPLPPVGALLRMAGLGAIGIFVGQTCQTLGVERTSASVATVISATIPLLVVVLAALRLRQKVSVSGGLGLASAFLGVALVAVGDPRNLAGVFSNHSLAGDGLVLASSVAVAAYYVLSVEWVRRYSAITVASWTSLAGAVLMLPLVCWELSTTTLQPTWQGIAVVLYLALLVTVAGIWIWLRALSRVPASIAASIQYLQPLVGVAASAAILGDTLDGWFFGGLILVLLGIALSAVGSRNTPLAPGRTPAKPAAVSSRS